MNLVDALELVFDRILDGNDLAVGCVDLVQRGVERGAFAAARWASDENDAVRRFQNIEEALERIALEAEGIEVEFDAFLVQQSDDDAFAIHRRHSRNTKIQLLALHLQLDTAILRQTTLGNVELGHDLDARYDRGC